MWLRVTGANSSAEGIRSQKEPPATKAKNKQKKKKHKNKRGVPTRTYTSYTEVDQPNNERKKPLAHPTEARASAHSLDSAKRIQAK